MKSWIALSKVFYLEKENLQVSLVTSRGLEEDEEDVLVSWLVLWYAENNVQEHDSLTKSLTARLRVKTFYVKFIELLIGHARSREDWCPEVASGIGYLVPSAFRVCFFGGSLNARIYIGC